MDIIEQTKISRAKNFVRRHKVPIAIVTTAAVTTAITVRMQRAGVKQLNDFLTEHGLIEKFYNPEA